jgi:hypothetical protein
MSEFIPSLKIGEFDVKTLGRDLADIIRSSVEGLVEGAQNDLALYANQMAEDAMRVMEIADSILREKLLKELVMQVRLVGEIHRLRAVQAAWDVVGKVFLTAVRMALKFLVPIV